MGCTGCLGRLFAFVLLVLFVILLPIGTWSFYLDKMLMDENTYLEPLERYQVYTRLPEQLLILAARANGGDEDAGKLNEMLSYLSEADMSEMVSVIAPAEWLREQAEYNVNALFLWLEDNSPAPDLRLNLRPLRNVLLSDGGRDVILQLVLSWPQCEPGQLSEWEAMLDGRAADFPICEPPPDMMDDLKEGLPELLSEIAGDIPDELTLKEALLEIGPDDEPSQEDVLHTFMQIKLGLVAAERSRPLMFLIPIALLGAMVVVAVRSVKGFFTWVGWALMLAGLLTLALPVVLVVIRGNTLEDILEAVATSSQVADLAGLLMIAQGVLSYAVERYMHPVLVQAVVLTVTGFVFVFTGALLRPPENVAQKSRRVQGA